MKSREQYEDPNWQSGLVCRLHRRVFQVIRNEWRSADAVSDFENGKDPTKLESRHMHTMSHAGKDVANGVSNFTVKSIVPKSSEHASAIGIVKDHGPSVAMQHDKKNCGIL